MGDIELIVDGVAYDVPDERTTMVTQGSCMVLLHAMGGLLHAVGGAYLQNQRWVVATFGQPRALVGVLDKSDVRSWVITEKQVSITAFSSSDAINSLRKGKAYPVIIPRSAVARLTPPEPPKHDVTYSPPTWEV